jgi:3-oxoacyl-[acyl-carrier protein] reductase
MLAFTHSLARAVVSRGMRVNALAPGFIDTELTRPFVATRTIFEAQPPMGRFGEADDVAWAALYWRAMKRNLSPGKHYRQTVAML